MRLKKFIPFLLLIMIMPLLTGCLHYMVSLELNSDNSGKLTYWGAYNTDMLGPDEDENESLTKLGNVDPTVAQVTIEPLKYEENGSNYEGNKATMIFDDADEFFNMYFSDESNNEDAKLISLPNGNKRLEFYVDLTEDEENAENGEADPILKNQDFFEMMAFSGGKIVYNVKTDHKVIDHNADKVENGVYTWDVLLKATDPKNAGKKLTLYIEYAPGNKAANTDSNAEKDDKRAIAIQKLGLDRNDMDFYGNALYKLGILKGTGKGLELDKGLTRAEGAVMYSRLLKLDDEIAKFEMENPDYETGFTDVPDWAKPTINYLHYRKLVNGVSRDKFGSSDLMTEAQYATLVLRALGYDDLKGDFVWNKANEKLKEIGLYDGDATDPDKMLSGPFTRRGMAYISFNALFFPNKATGEVLIDKFIE